MSEYRVATRYARSVFDLAIEQKCLENVYKDMVLLSQVCADNRKLVVLLKNPIVRYDYKLKILHRIFDKHVDELSSKFFNLICKKNRADILPEVSEVFVSLYRDHKGIVSAEVASAVELSADLKKEFEGIISRATGKKVDLETAVDDSLIGGFVLRVGDNQVDDSLKSKLNSLRRELKARP